jgi:hypothetical protein
MWHCSNAAFDMAAYVKYYNSDRLHTANGGVSPIHFETSKKSIQ